MMKLALLVSMALVSLIQANEFKIDDHVIPNEFFKGLRDTKTPDERLGKLNQYIAHYVDNKTREYEDMPFLYRKLYSAHTPEFHHDEVTRDHKTDWDPEHLKEIDAMPFLKRVWARTKHPESCAKCNGLDKYKRQLDEKMVEKMRNITAVEEQLRHGKNHEKCHSHGNCDSHGDDETVEAAVVYADVSSNEEKRREEEILKEKRRNEAIEKLNYHFYRRAVMEARLTGESPEQIFKQYHRMSPEQLQQRFHAVYQKYVEMKKKMQDYYKNNQHKEGEIRKDYVKSLEKKEGLEQHLQKYQKFLREVQERKRAEEEAKKAQEAKRVDEIRRAEIEKRRREQMIQEQQKHKQIYDKYLAEQRKVKEQKEKDEEYKKQELASLDKQLNEINILKENIKREIERTKKEGDEKDLVSLEKLENELLQWENKVKTDKNFKLSTLNVVSDKINTLREKLLAELKMDVVHGHHRNEESFENAKKRYLHVKENFNKQVNKVRDSLVKQNKEEDEDYDSEVYKDEDEEEDEHEEDYNTHERQLMEIDELKNHLTEELDKAKREGKHVRDIYQLEGARKQIEDWEERVKSDNVHHYEKASLVNKKIGEFKGFINSYKVYKYSTTPPPEA